MIEMIEIDLKHVFNFIWLILYSRLLAMSIEREEREREIDTFCKVPRTNYYDGVLRFMMHLTLLHLPFEVVRVF